MSESVFEVQVRLALNDSYHPFGVFWNNKTGYSDGEMVKNHDPFPGRGAGDLIGCVFGLWIEVENKEQKGKWRELQKVRNTLVTNCGGLYIVCREIGFNCAGDFDAGFVKLRLAIDKRVRVYRGDFAAEMLETMRIKKAAQGHK